MDLAKRCTVPLLVVLLAGCATTSAQRQGMCWGALAADAVTTAQIRHDPDVVERAPITRDLLGSEPEAAETAAYFAALGLLHWVIGQQLPEPWRERWQWACVVISGAYVINNCAQGLCD